MMMKHAQGSKRCHFAGAVTLSVVLTLLDPKAPSACTPWAERVVAWDAATDLAVVATWKGTERPPTAPRAQPAWYGLRRISTGEQVSLHRCPEGEVCDWKMAFAKWLPSEPRGGRTGDRATGVALRVRRELTSAAQEFALEVRGKVGWRRVLWLDFIPRGYREHRRYSFGPSAIAGSDVLLAVQYHSRGGNCNQTVVQVVRLRQADLADPTNASRREHMLAHVRQDAPLEHWRTLAELGPLPPDRLLEALSLAENEGRWAWGAKWWRESIARMPPAQVESVTAALQRHPSLASTRELLGFATAPKQN
jgi:hypothetical protein